MYRSLLIIALALLFLTEVSAQMPVIGYGENQQAAKANAQLLLTKLENTMGQKLEIVGEEYDKLLEQWWLCVLQVNLPERYAKDSNVCLTITGMGTTPEAAEYQAFDNLRKAEEMTGHKYEIVKEEIKPTSPTSWICILDVRAIQAGQTLDFARLAGVGDTMVAAKVNALEHLKKLTSVTGKPFEVICESNSQLAPKMWVCILMVKRCTERLNQDATLGRVPGIGKIQEEANTNAIEHLKQMEQAAAKKFEVVKQEFYQVGDQFWACVLFIRCIGQ